MKKVNLAKAIWKNKKCLGYAWQMVKGKYEYQNDNDLGLDFESINGLLPYNKKVYVGNGYYFYVMRGIWGNEKDKAANAWVTLNMVKILLKECHSALFTLTKREQTLAKKYWGNF